MQLQWRVISSMWVFYFMQTLENGPYSWKNKSWKFLEAFSVWAPRRINSPAITGLLIVTNTAAYLFHLPPKHTEKNCRLSLFSMWCSRMFTMYITGRCPGYIEVPCLKIKNMTVLDNNRTETCFSNASFMCLLSFSLATLSQRKKKKEAWVDFEQHLAEQLYRGHRVMRFQKQMHISIFLLVLKPWHGLGRTNQRWAQRPVSASQRCKNNMSTLLNTYTLKSAATSCDSWD